MTSDNLDEGIQCDYEGGLAGMVLTDRLPDKAGVFDFMPFRSISHYQLWMAVEKDRRPDVTLVLGQERTVATVAALTPRTITLDPRVTVE